MIRKWRGVWLTKRFYTQFVEVNARTLRDLSVDNALLLHAQWICVGHKAAFSFALYWGVEAKHKIIPRRCCFYDVMLCNKKA